MDPDDLFMIAMALVLFAAAFAAGFRARRHAIRIDNVGAGYGMRRLPGESTPDFAKRIRAKQTWISGQPGRHRSPRW